ncbi:hypothetical protein PtA15_16A66 [Puccinia triticina]|uniref:RRM domain-containing protein n=1 Tax=Puccinia triticina TaxID=208348 RepID=A0ABY7D5J4_9BASI|nr:uncharacterized protein PtA15_16A66 [Puccinia triticina]WAQ92160.1 hypothetical protein PtA15_16A66 [Puccinia triticina]
MATPFDPAALFFSSTAPPPISRNLSSVGSTAPSAIGMSTNQSGPTPEAEDDIIPTAIVIKNIPFSVRREQLLAIIEDLMIPLPYAFNYHFDNGVFRGLAFANFRSASEADAAVAGLNGFDISGRKLRVEYKKVLQAGEKERIEKEKAIKRMRSMQLQKESSLLDQYNSSAQQQQQQQQQPASSTHISFGNYSHHEDDFRGIAHRPSQSLLNPNAQQQHHQQHPFLSSSHDLTSSAQQAFESFSLSSVAALDPKQQSSKELDMNDPQTLELYSRVVVFKEDKLRDELAFAKALSGPQRRIVHQIAKKLGLVHRSEGQGDERFVVVSKLSGSAPAAPPRMMSRVASAANMARAASGLHLSSALPPQHHAHQGGQYAGPGSSASALRMKKSMPDMRVRELHSGVFYPEPRPDLPAPPFLAARKSHLSLRDPSSKQPGLAFADELANGAFLHHPQFQHHQQQQALASHQIIRQPKGPEGGAGKGFANNNATPICRPAADDPGRASSNDLL